MKHTHLVATLPYLVALGFCLIVCGAVLEGITHHAGLLLVGLALASVSLLLFRSAARAAQRQHLQFRKATQALPAPAAPALAASDGFALLDERFQAVAQVRARHFQQGTIDLLEWRGRYQALLQARHEIETSAFRESVLRLDEYRAAMHSRQRQQRYERKLNALCDETMEAILQRADALMAQPAQK
jgi:ABC-type taurine transport system ATPase subunit